MPDVYYDSTLTGQELDEALRAIPDNLKRSETAAKAAESWAQGGTETRPGEDEDNAEYWAKRAKADAGTASAGAQTVTDNREALQAVLDNLDAVKDAAKNAELAEAAAESAATDAERAEAAAKNAQSIAQGQKGYYETPEALQAAHETGDAGDWAIVGSTDTVWIWDTDTQAWLNSGNNIDLSHYYTKDETDQQIDELQKALAPQIAEANTAAQNAVSRRWELSVTADGWQQQEDGRYTKALSAEGVTADTKFSPSVGAKPSGAASLDERKAAQAALGCISELEAGDGAVTLICYEQAPETTFDIILEEVR